MEIGQFTINATEGNARAGVLQTAHGAIQTPVFMPVGTRASVKSLDPRVVAELGAQIVLGNTYHLYLAPGDELIRNLGGLHHFMQWDKPILTDSGGFQVFSLGLGKKERSSSVIPDSSHSEETIRVSKKTDRLQLVDRDDDDVEKTIPEARITENGVEFKSHRDGTKHFFTPEKSIEIQANLGADIIMAFDECAPYPSTQEYYREAMERTHRWLDRSIEHKCKLAQEGKSHDQLLFGIVQGGIINELREESAQYLSSKGLPGVAIGGVAVGESYQDKLQQVEWVMPHLPQNVPHYLMGVGTPLDLVEFVARGIDMFDCVLPTRLARNGAVWIVEDETWSMKHESRESDISIVIPDLAKREYSVIHEKGRNDSKSNLNNKLKGKRVQIKNAQFKADARPLQEGCLCSTCTRFSRAYIHHLFMENEPLGMQLTSVHNLHVLIDEMKQIRQSIINGTFAELRAHLNSVWGNI